MTDKLENVAVQTIRDMAVAAAGNRTITFAGVEPLDYILIPPGYSMKTMDEYQDAPRRIRETVKFTTVASFAYYVTKFGDPSSLLSGNMKAKAILNCVLDYHRPDGAAWCSHSVELIAESTPAWATWVGNNKQRMSQRDFGNFVEDNAEDVAAPDLAALLTQIREVKIGRAGATTSRQTTTEAHTANERTTEVKSGLPDLITLALAPYQFSPAYKVNARPFIHVDGESISFSYHLVNVERVLQSAFAACVEEVAALTGMQVYV